MARALDGLTGGNVSVANAYLSDISNHENRQKNFGRMAMSGSLGLLSVQPWLVFWGQVPGQNCLLC
ncbi:MAG: MFS transporter [Microscillaceae bacterium]|nr:MFS transporter [Microscillaceae bacterium]